MIDIKLKTSGIDRLKRVVQDAKRRAQESIEFSDYVASRAYTECIRHFQDEQGPEGKWNPLSPVTIARRRHGSGSGSTKILQDTGRLRSSILFRGFKNMALVFTNIAYGGVHQYGWKQIPARPFLWVGDDFMKKMASAYSKFVKGDWK